MSLKDYTVPIEDRMRVKHTAMARFTVKSGNTILQDELTPSDCLNGAITVASVMYNANPYSGGGLWFNPATGKSISRPKWQIRFREQDILRGNEECDCTKCMS